MSTTAESQIGVESGNEPVSKLLILKCAVLVVLFAAAAALESGRLDALGNSSSWLHLRVGSWMLEHRSLPRSGVASRAELPWNDPNWSLQFVTALIYRTLGARVFSIGVMFFRMLFGVLMFVLAGGRRGFWRAALISAWAQVAILSPGLPTSPYSGVFLAILVLLLQGGSREERQRYIHAVPLLIIIWVNTDWRFIYGVFAVLLFCGAAAVAPSLQQRSGHIGLGRRPALPLATAAMVAGATCIASLLSPYSYHSYVTAAQNLFGPTPLQHDTMLKALNFREPAQYVLMLLAMCAFLALGRGHARDLFHVLSLVAGVFLSFAFGSEAWVIVVLSCAVMGNSPSEEAQLGEAGQLPSKAFWSAAVAAVLVLVTLAAQLPTGPKAMDIAAKKLPVKACEFVQQNKLPGPIYNEVNWGGFIAWYLPDYPVAIDNRYELYGEGRTATVNMAVLGFTRPSEDPNFTSANTAILSTSSQLVSGIDSFLDRDEAFHFIFPGFREVYRDGQAIVLTREP